MSEDRRCKECGRPRVRGEERCIGCGVLHAPPTARELATARFFGFALGLGLVLGLLAALRCSSGR